MTTSLRQADQEKHKVRRRATSHGLSFGPIATAITVGIVAILVGVTFIGDWVRIPQIAAEASPSIISPNGDQAQDSTNFSYTLNEDAEVTVQVLNQHGRLIRTLLAREFQTRGQHVAIWDGRNDLGQSVEDGQYQIQATARGTVRASSQAANVTVDTQAPLLRLANLEQVTRVRDANLTVEGLTDPNAVVQLAGDLAMVPVDADGRFSIKRQLAEGSNLIEVAATDSAGNVATVSREAILVTRPPEVTITSPANGDWTNESLIQVAGTIPPGTSLRINGQEAVVDAGGTFNREVILQEGENLLRIEATDDVGNITSQEILVRRKTSAPQLTVNIEEGEVFQQSEIQVIGKTDAGAKLTVGGQVVPVSSLGEFQTTVNLLNGENLLDVVAQDQAGNTSRLQRRVNFNVSAPESEFARVMRNLPDLSMYFVPVLIALPILLILAYVVTRPVSLVVSAESSSFRPGLPEEGRYMRMSIDLSKPARTTVEIKDRRGNTVATLLHRRHRSSGQHALHWDGYDDFGRVAPPGEYSISASAATTGGTVHGSLNISIVPDQAVHRQYLRSAPYQDDGYVIDRRTGSAVKTTPSTRGRRR
jgi:flagellar hook assembly protein FlgD